MSKNDWKDLDEDNDIKWVNIHLHRFARFIRFLKHHEATIEIKQTDEATNETHTNLYTSKSRDGNPSLKDLLIQSIGAPPSYWNTLTSRKLGLDDRHTDGDRRTEPGKVIEAISFSLGEVDSLSSDQGSYLVSEEPFSTRHTGYHQLTKYTSYKVLEKYQRPKEWTHYLTDVYADSAGWTASNLPGMLGEYETFQFIGEDFQPFVDYAKELARSNPRMYLKRGEVVVFEYGRRLADLLKLLEKMSRYYFKMTVNPNEKDRQKYDRWQEEDWEPEATIIPGYWDFYYPHNRENILEYIQEHEISKNKLLQITEHNLGELIDHRYEILWTLDDMSIPVTEWSTAQQGLLFLVLAEYRAAKETLIWASKKIVKDLRFTVLTSNGDGTPSYQKSAMDLDALSRFLKDYNFVHGLTRTINITDLNILDKVLYRFPDPDAVVEKYSQRKIYEYIEKELKKNFFYRVRDDLYISKSITY